MVALNTICKGHWNWHYKDATNSLESRDSKDIAKDSVEILRIMIRYQNFQFDSVWYDFKWIWKNENEYENLETLENHFS